MLSDVLDWIDPEIIIVDRELRQRKSIDITDLIPSIRSRGILHPIIIDRNRKLIAGERRLVTAKYLKMEWVPIRYSDSLSALEHRLIELEENTRRLDLTWQERALGILEIHKIYEVAETEWSVDKTALHVGLDPSWTYTVLALAEAIAEGDTAIVEADTQANARTILARRKARAQGEVMNRILEVEDDDFTETGTDNDPSNDPAAAVAGDNHSAPSQARSSKVKLPTYIIEHGDATKLFSEYSGPKFNFLHCDFPYGVNLNEQAGQAGFEAGGYDGGEEVYWQLLGSMVHGWNNFMYPNAHVMFWISMKHYTATIAYFEKAAADGLLPSDLKINPTPLIWHKTDNKGILPDPMRMPRNIYEAALIMSTGDRNLVKPKSNVYGCPTSKGADAIHTNEKPEPMLRNFFEMFVDSHSRVLDPTCGSGSSIRAAESCRAESALGLEFNPVFAERAAAKLVQSRNIRNLSDSLGLQQNPEPAPEPA